MKSVSKKKKRREHSRERKSSRSRTRSSRSRERKNSHSRERKSSRSREIIRSRSREIKRSRSREIKRSRSRERRSRSVERKGSRKGEIKRSRSRERKGSRSREIKSSRSRARKSSPSRERKNHIRERKGSPSHDRRKEEPPVKKSRLEEMIEAAEKSASGNKKIQKPWDPISSRTGGAYIPPAQLKLMQAAITDKSSVEYQRIAWEALKKSIHGLINKVNKSNIGKVIRQLLRENIVRGRGLLCRSLLQAQAMSPTFTHVYAALAALVNSRFPNIGELLLSRLVLQFRRGFRRNDKPTCIASCSFIAHLINQRVAHEILGLEMLTLLFERPNEDSVELAIAFLKECGQKLGEVSKKGLDAVFETLRNILHEGNLDKRIQYMIEVMYQVRKDKFKDNPAIPDGLDLVEEDDQFTHLIVLEDVKDAQDILNVFKHDPDYLEHEEKYKALSREMLGESADEDDENEGSGEEGDDDEDEDEEGEEEVKEKDDQGVIIDKTETNLVALRRTIYLTIYSSLDFEECAHKLLKMQLKPGQEKELCAMIVDCCCEMRTYERFYGLLAQRFCQVNSEFIPPFEAMFKETYETVHRLKTSQCRNVAKFFAHLLYTDAIAWTVLSCIHLNEDETTSSGRIFIKILFHELSEYMGLTKLNERVKDSTLHETAFAGLFPRNNPRNTRFSINFFTSIGLGGLTDDLREHLKKVVVPAAVPEIPDDESSSSSSSSSSSDEDSSSSSHS